MKCPDLVSIIEAAYAIDTPEQEWLEAIVRAARPSMDAGLGINGYFYDLGARPIKAGGYVDLDCAISSKVFAATLENITDEYIDQSFKVSPCGLASEVPGFSEQPAVKLHFHPHGVRDNLALNACDPSGLGIFIGAPLPRKGRLTGFECGKA